MRQTRHRLLGLALELPRKTRLRRKPWLWR